MTIVTSKNIPPAWGTIIYLAIIHFVALFAILPSNFSWGALGVAFILYVITAGVGITLGFHRLVAHRSYQVPQLLEYCLIFCGTLAGQGGPLDWIGLHRIHHQYSDLESDPHNSLKGFFWSHLGWMLCQNPANEKIARYTKDISGDRFYQFCQHGMIPIQLVLAGSLYYFGGLPWVIWGVFVRLVVVFHCTWFVNSATHKFGYKSYESDDTSLNCWWVALLTFGEGWHNNHHAFQYSARHGLEWWEIDLTWMMIKTLSFLGLATNVKLPPNKGKRVTS
ncbi:acyl-CoA desaturase [Pleurocapsa sp. CCALA 161]|uniref:acyl-CoA desaturase n=1 Tax=Pleurocapsa sp. CCALA 161 TaxID=2107688 RepID=UPI000D0700AA|nr:fatty acid desaturase [Pleurocapsa sp. CCALA 161]PSB12391.1 acyl-CoA desaturase [Pleurocapsa sp. CCALA 161]